MTLAEHIEELIAELRGALTRRERNAVRAELAGAIAAQAEIERAPAGVARARGGDHVCKVSELFDSWPPPRPWPCG